MMSSKCIFCKRQVRPRQEGFQCDGCLRWQHRTCETGVSQSSYRSAVKTGSSIDWLCSTCDVPQAESTPILFSESDLILILKPTQLQILPSTSLRPKDPLDLNLLKGSSRPSSCEQMSESRVRGT